MSKNAFRVIFILCQCIKGYDSRLGALFEFDNRTGRTERKSLEILVAQSWIPGNFWMKVDCRCIETRHTIEPVL